MYPVFIYTVPNAKRLIVCFVLDFLKDTANDWSQWQSNNV
jgi:hypothetical protein